MKLEDQKEFLDYIMNYHKRAKDSKINLNEVVNNINKQMKSQLGENKMNLNVFFDSKGFFDVDAFCDFSKTLDLEPIDIFDYIVNKVQDKQSFTHMGQTIDFSSANDFFDKAKKKFEEYKKSEDINNF